jgi:hypothetical protein
LNRLDGTEYEVRIDLPSHSEICERNPEAAALYPDLQFEAKPIYGNLKFKQRLDVDGNRTKGNKANILVQEELA